MAVDLPVLAERLRHTRELLEARMDAGDQALLLQATELERRLNVLNHAHEEALRVQATYLSRDDYEPRHTTLIEADDLLRSDIRRLELTATGYLSRAEWELWLQRQEDQRRADRRSLTTALVGAVIALLIGIGEIIISIVSHTHP